MFLEQWCDIVVYINKRCSETDKIEIAQQLRGCFYSAGIKTYEL